METVTNTEANRQSPEVGMEPDFFMDALMNNFFIPLTEIPPQQKQERSTALLKMMTDTQDELLQSHNAELLNDNTQKPHVVLVGQSHNNAEDLKMALKHAEETHEKNGVLILERQGILHPNLESAKEDTMIADKGKRANSIVITEADIFGVRGKNLNHTERGQLTGMYVANLIAKNPDRPITIIVGENHIKDIERSINVFLEYMDASFTPTITLIESHDKSTSVQDAKPFNLTMLIDKTIPEGNQSEEVYQPKEIVSATPLLDQLLTMHDKQETWFNSFAAGYEERINKDTLKKILEKQLRENLPDCPNSSSTYSQFIDWVNNEAEAAWGKTEAVNDGPTTDDSAADMPVGDNPLPTADASSPDAVPAVASPRWMGIPAGMTQADMDRAVPLQPWAAEAGKGSSTAADNAPDSSEFSLGK